MRAVKRQCHLEHFRGELVAELQPIEMIRTFAVIERDPVKLPLPRSVKRVEMAVPQPSSASLAALMSCAKAAGVSRQSEREN